ncbi:TPA: hypothetical protein HA280_04225, partial [Candidatus Woesearchaeota archaeon]|nr:hypothetical protein [Candidatus Woesearchaeota archaeon]
MGKLWDFAASKEPLKMVIMDYNYKIIDILQYSDKYRADHWQVFKKKTDKKVVSDEEFFARLSSFISIEKI